MSAVFPPLDGPGFAPPMPDRVIAQLLVPPHTIAAEASIPAATLDPVATGPEQPPADYYEQAMRANLATLERTLGHR